MAGEADDAQGDLIRHQHDVPDTVDQVIRAAAIFGEAALGHEAKFIVAHRRPVRHQLDVTP